MDTAKIVALKQEQISLDSQIQELSKKLKSKQVYLVVAVVFLLLAFILFAVATEAEGLFFFLFAVPAIVFFVLAFKGKMKAKDELAQSKNRLQQIKMELVQLEHT